MPLFETASTYSRTMASASARPTKPVAVSLVTRSSNVPGYPATPVSVAAGSIPMMLTGGATVSISRSSRKSG